jgi:hypothetical protein
LDGVVFPEGSGVISTSMIDDFVLFARCPQRVGSSDGSDWGTNMLAIIIDYVRGVYRFGIVTRFLALFAFTRVGYSKLWAMPLTQLELFNMCVSAVRANA